jgi:hypothetical protein
MAATRKIASTDIFQPVGTLERLTGRISAEVIHHVGTLG